MSTPHKMLCIADGLIIFFLACHYMQLDKSSLMHHPIACRDKLLFTMSLSSWSSKKKNPWNLILSNSMGKVNAIYLAYQVLSAFKY